MPESTVTEAIVKHTPGPWTMVGREIFGQAFDQSARLICDKVKGGSPESADANARLIAAAPDLLAVVRRFVQLYDGVRDSLGPSVSNMLAHAEAVIAKAGGPPLERIRR